MLFWFDLVLLAYRIEPQGYSPIYSTISLKRLGIVISGLMQQICSKSLNSLKVPIGMSLLLPNLF